MKKSILVLAVCTLISGAIITSCSSSSQKVENAEENVAKANDALDDANEEYLADIENYKREAEIKMAANDKSIADFNARIANEKKEAKADYQKKIKEIEQKNTDMRKSIADYKADGKENWELFKADFNKEMNDWAELFEKITVKNK